MRPRVLRWIDSGGVGRKIFRMNAGVTLQKILHQLTAMNRPPIPQQDHRAAQVTEQGLEEPHHFFARRVRR